MSIAEEMEFIVSVDNSEVEQDLAQMEMHAAQVGASVQQTTRRAYISLGLLLDIVGIAIPQTIQIFASAAFMAGEMLLELGTAETITGVLAVKALLTFSLAAILFSRAAYLQGESMKVEHTLNNIVNVYSQWY